MSETYVRPILNLTQHMATSAQVKDGVVDLPEDLRAKVVELLTFEAVPSRKKLKLCAQEIAKIAYDLSAERVMIGGAPYFMSALEAALIARGIQPLYSFSKRESAEIVQCDGSVKEGSIFTHVCFISAV